MTKKEITSFDAFAARFVRAYWQDTVEHSGELPPYEPIDRTLDECLADMSFTTSHETAVGENGKVRVLRMVSKGYGSTWRFLFQKARGRWTIVAAFANDETDEHRVDLLDETYAQWFRPILDRAIASATRC